MRDKQTITALSTPIGKGGIAVIRISGENSKKIIKKIYKGKTEERKINYGTIYIENKPIDDVILLYYKKPRSYTGEDVIEIQTHGSMVIVEEILNYLFSNGVRVAEPGEFTKRAFLNGKIDLIQAEAIKNIIDSITIKGVEIALANLKGSLSKKVEQIRETVIELLSMVEASIDFPDYEIKVEKNKIIENLSKIKRIALKLSDSYNYGKILKEGYDIVLTGKPNVGKSSLLNAFLKEKRAIVSEHPGTTRDFIKEKINYKGVGFNIIDVAGIDENGTGVIEKEGVKIAKEMIGKTENILFMIDGSEKIEDRDREIFEMIRGKNIIIVINKIDKKPKVKEEEIIGEFKEVEWIEYISAKKEINIKNLLETMLEKFVKREKKVAENILLSLRQKQIFDEIVKETEKAISRTKINFEEEIVAENIREIKKSTEELTGKISNELVLDRIFKDFCIGK